jgi:hypothetical protein
MPRKSLNRSLHAAKATKQDEFYTQLTDIEKELVHYKKHFRNKTVLCNCDDPRVSNFFKYFLNNFEVLHLKKLITTCYQNDKPDLFSQHKSDKGIYFEYSGEQKGNRLPDPAKITPRELTLDGDFRSEECVNLLKQADIVVTNPPFSLFREYVEQLVRYRRKFLVIGAKNAIHYQEIFKLIKENKIWVGVTPMGVDLLFDVPAEYARKMLATGKEASSYKVVNGVVKGRSPSIWFTNMDNPKRHELLPLYRHYSPSDYPTYDNLAAIEVARTSEIPCDYDGWMGVPDTFLDKYNPDQFELIGIPFGDLGKELGVKKNHRGRTDIAITQNGKSRCPYSRIIIKRKK